MVNRVWKRLVEITYVCDVMTFYAKQGRRFLKPQGVTPHLLRNKKVTTIYNPRGVIGMITPWNFPLILTIGEAIPALMAGNAVVIKPSEWTPLIAERGAALLQQAFASWRVCRRRFCRSVNGYGDTGGALVDEADMIAFTGSIRTGKAVAARAAQRLIPVSLELGGKDPMIVLRDAGHRTRRQCSRLGRVHQFRPGLHFGRARLRRRTPSPKNSPAAWWKKLKPCDKAAT